MENLKNTISKTETLKNNIKIINNKINESVLRGGYTSNSLAEKPKRIESMLGQYSKVAVINQEFKLEKIDNNSLEASKNTIPINLDFIPSIVIVALKNNVTGEGTYKENINSNINNTRNTVTTGNIAGWIDKTSITRESFNIHINWTNPQMVPRTRQIICIS